MKRICIYVEGYLTMLHGDEGYADFDPSVSPEQNAQRVLGHSGYVVEHATIDSEEEI